MPEGKPEVTFEMYAQEAIESLRPKIAAMTPEQKAGAMIIINWIRAWFNKAGYKHLCRNLLKEF